MTPTATPELARDAMASFAAPFLLAVIGEDGWMSHTEPPDTDRLVQLAWDDMSYGENSRGFYDSLAEIPASGKMFWWSWPVGGGMHRLPSDHIGAWREMTANSSNGTNSLSPAEQPPNDPSETVGRDASEGASAALPGNQSETNGVLRQPNDRS